MQEAKTKIRKQNSDARRSEMISATLRVIARDGLKAATVRSISKEAKVTQGLIRYYFQSKDELFAAAYEVFMADLVFTADRASRGKDTAKHRLSKFIQVSLDAPVTSHESVAIWAGFFQLLLHDERMTQSHKRSYDVLRLHLKTLIEEVFAEQGKEASPEKLRRLSIAGNAILDGLWIEGGALPRAFEKGELVQIGLESFSALLGVELR